jgi:hypothetical protein
MLGEANGHIAITILNSFVIVSKGALFIILGVTVASKANVRVSSMLFTFLRMTNALFSRSKLEDTRARVTKFVARIVEDR